MSVLICSCISECICFCSFRSCSEYSCISRCIRFCSLMSSPECCNILLAWISMVFSFSSTKCADPFRSFTTCSVSNLKASLLQRRYHPQFRQLWSSIMILTELSHSGSLSYSCHTVGGKYGDHPSSSNSFWESFLRDHSLRLSNGVQLQKCSKEMTGAQLLLPTWKAIKKSKKMEKIMSKLTGGDDTLMQSLWRMRGKWSVRGRSMRWCTWEWGLNQSNEWLLLLGLMLEENNWSVSLLILPSTLPLAEFPCRMPGVRCKPDANMNPLHFDVELSRQDHGLLSNCSGCFQNQYQISRADDPDVLILLLKGLHYLDEHGTSIVGRMQQTMSSKAWLLSLLSHRW